MATRLRVGAVSYLNAKPLYFGLADAAPEVSLSMDVPSRLADRLAAGELDVALIPSVEYLRGASLGYEIVPGIAIAARGAVRSVKLFSRVAVRADPAAGARRGVADEPGAGEGLARCRARGPARPDRDLADGSPGAGEHRRRRARHRRPGDERPRRVVPCGGRPGRGLGRDDRLAVRLRDLGGPARGRPRRPCPRRWRAAGPRAWRTRTTWRPSTVRGSAWMSRPVTIT